MVTCLLIINSQPRVYTLIMPLNLHHKVLNDYCTSIRINVEHLCRMFTHKMDLPHVHTQNGLAESFIKRLQLIARPLLMKSKLPMSEWGLAILHTTSLIRIGSEKSY